MNLDQLSALGQGVGGIAVDCIDRITRRSVYPRSVANRHSSVPRNQGWKRLVGDVDESS